jgi:predicted metal-dependent phosphoesterase TrpH
MIKADLHTHSVLSHDGGIDEEDIQKALVIKTLDLIAITDHNTIRYAQNLKRMSSLKHSIIVGEEIDTRNGELIGLFLSEEIKPGMGVLETALEIQKQGGVIIAPHPLDKRRHSLSLESLNKIAHILDAIELFNGRAIGMKKPRNLLAEWAKTNSCPAIASSDAHSYSGLGRTFTTLPDMPASPEELRVLLRTSISITYSRPPIRAFLAPRFNRLRRTFRT